MATKVQQIEGAKGSDVYNSSGSALVDLSVRLVRDAWSDDMNDLFSKAIEASEDDAFVLAFQTRDIRGGKGERKLFGKMVELLLKNRPQLMVGLLDLIPEYGCWRDLYTEHFYGYRPDVAALVVKQLKADAAKVASAAANPEMSEAAISLCAKWAPREGKDTEGAKAMAALLFPTEPKLSQRLKSYRKLVAGLNRRLDTTEIKMCGKHFADINPAKVPGVCLAKHMKAFLNEQGSSKKGGRTHRDLRHPDDPDRMACREHFQEHMSKAARGEAKVNGSVTRYPHQVIKDVICGAEGAERESLIAVWNGMVANAKALGGLGRTIAMCDFSGSMRSSSSGDTPYLVSMAMGLLIAEVCSDEFKDTFMTFDSSPQWHKLPAAADIFSRVNSIGNCGQGLSTDFQKAMDLVLATLKEKRVRPGQEPKDLIVITDMAWDAACGSSQQSVHTGNSYRHVVKTNPWQTHIQMIRESFRRAGEDMWGAAYGWKPPRIVIWNVAATCVNFHATADTEGVIMLSGWSPSLFKVLTEEGARVQTPLEALRIQLDDERYDPIRKRLASLRLPPIRIPQPVRSYGIATSPM